MKAIIVGGKNHFPTPSDFARLQNFVTTNNLNAVCVPPIPGVANAVRIWARQQANLKVNIALENIDPSLSQAAIQKSGADSMVLFPGDDQLDYVLNTARELGLTIYDWRNQ